jgi:hypothetical protein
MTEREIHREWPEPRTEGMRAADTFAPWISYHYPYTDDEAASLGCAVIDAHCQHCGITTRIIIPMPDEPSDDEEPPSGISVQRSLFTMDHLHGMRTYR